MNTAQLILSIWIPFDGCSSILIQTLFRIRRKFCHVHDDILQRILLNIWDEWMFQCSTYTLHKNPFRLLFRSHCYF
ncbi:hypothetical protein BDF21DRAFT_405836 [Thamnidium elegans]|nr:hypothetical protein BDF21DRAFT_405836 [Thamnidium elegans]